MESVLRCRGLLRAAEGDMAGAFAAFERALTEQPDPAWPFERARTLLCLGTVRRQAQQKKAAREALEQALGDLRGAGRAALGRKGACRAEADQRP